LPIHNRKFSIERVHTKDYHCFKKNAKL
jgi:hypothetical protein